MAPKPILLISSGSKKKEPRCACLSEANASHSHSIWAEVSSLTPHFLHKGLSCSPSRWRCLRRVLWPVSRPAGYNPGLKPIKGHEFRLGTQTRSQDKLSSLSLGITRTLPLGPVLVTQPATEPSLQILPRDTQGRLRSKEPLFLLYMCPYVQQILILCIYVVVNWKKLLCNWERLCQT